MTIIKSKLLHPETGLPITDLFVTGRGWFFYCPKRKAYVPNKIGHYLLESDIPNIIHSRSATTVMEAKMIRAAVANELVAEIASRGHKFLGHKGATSYFEIDPRGRIWFIEAKRMRRHYMPHKEHHWGQHFSEGGTMKSLVHSLSWFIRDGKNWDIRLGPWPNYICDGDLWGYGAEMQPIRDKAKELGLA